MENNENYKEYTKFFVNKLNRIIIGRECPKKIMCINNTNELIAFFQDDMTREEKLIQGGVEYILPVVLPENLGNTKFKETYETKFAYYAGAMANGISSVEMLKALSNSGFIGSYGTGGLRINFIENAIKEMKRLNIKFMLNLLNSAGREQQEFEMITMCIKHKVKVIEASAYITITKPLVYYRIAGIKGIEGKKIICENHIVAKVSREEVALKFMNPAPEEIVNGLLEDGYITEKQANLARYLSMADDITVEADSGGHTDNRPLVSLFPGILALKNKIQSEMNYDSEIRLGAGGGISSPSSAVAAFEMGADYIVTGSINQSCREAGTSEHVKQVLCQTTMSDAVMAPAADMFETGGKVQVTKKGTMFPMNAQKLYNLYSTYESIEDIPQIILQDIEKRVLHKTVDEVWQETKEYFERVSPSKIKKANENSKVKMALIFRWYLGNSSRWAINGVKDRVLDMQIWCGQSMGAFNNWVNGSYLERPENRSVVEVSRQIMNGSAYILTLNTLKRAGVNIQDYLEYKIMK